MAKPAPPKPVPVPVPVKQPEIDPVAAAIGAIQGLAPVAAAVVPAPVAAGVAVAGAILGAITDAVTPDAPEVDQGAPEPGPEVVLQPMNVDALAKHLAEQAFIYVNANGMQHNWSRYRSAASRMVTHIKIRWPQREELV